MAQSGSSSSHSHSPHLRPPQPGLPNSPLASPTASASSSPIVLMDEGDLDGLPQPRSKNASVTALLLGNEKPVASTTTGTPLAPMPSIRKTAHLRSYSNALASVLADGLAVVPDSALSTGSPASSSLTCMSSNSSFQSANTRYDGSAKESTTQSPAFKTTYDMGQIDVKDTTKASPREAIAELKGVDALEAVVLPPAEVIREEAVIEEVKPKSTLWMGDLESWMDDHYLKQVWASVGEERVVVKVIRDRWTLLPSTFAFVDFPSHEHASDVLERFNGKPIPGQTTAIFKLNWASGGGIIDDRKKQPEWSVFVGDLANDVTDEILRNAFMALLPSTTSAKVVMDPRTGHSRGYGFVRFSTGNDATKAMSSMSGRLLLGRAIRVSPATPKGLRKLGPCSVDHVPALQEPLYQNHKASGPYTEPVAGRPFDSTLPYPTVFPSDPNADARRLSLVSPPVDAYFSSVQEKPTDANVYARSASLPISSARPAFADALLPSASFARPAYMPPSFPPGVPMPIRSFRPAYIGVPTLPPYPPAFASPSGYSPVETMPPQMPYPYPTVPAPYPLMAPHNAARMSNVVNTTVYVGTLPDQVTEDELHRHFSPFGLIHSIKMPPGRHCAFIVFQHVEDSERAIENMQGISLHDQVIRVARGKTHR